MTQQFSRELLSGKATLLLTHWHQVPLLSEMRIGLLWVELCSPPAGIRDYLFFSAEIILIRERTSFCKFVKSVASEGEKYWMRNIWSLLAPRFSV